MCTSFRTYTRDVNPFQTNTMRRLFGLDVSINWPSNRYWQTKILYSWKATQPNLLRQKVLSCVKHHTKFGTNQFTSVLTEDNVNCTLYYIMSREFSPLNSTCAKYIKQKLQQTSRLWQQTEFHLNQLQNFWENGHQSFWFLIQLWP